MRPKARKAFLLIHITTSIGWLGAIACTLPLSITGMTSGNLDTVRAAYVALELIGWYGLVPFSIASLVTGVVQSLVTKWGLFRHYWVIAKLFINVVCVLFLLTYMQTLRYLADLTQTASSIEDLRSPSPILHAAIALALLLAATVLAVYKPRGITRFARTNPGS